MSDTKIVVDIFPAVGGPKTSGMGSDGFEQGPTDKGTYMIAYCNKHTSNRYKTWSKVTWGTPLKEERGTLYVNVRDDKGDKRWKKLSEFSSATRADVLKYHEDLYGKKAIPDKWVFNDFGHMTCYYFKDVNDNKKKDKRERVYGEFIHTTPVNEAETAKSKPVILTESHGCVHVKPKDIDVMIKKGYIKRNNKFIVHDYAEIPPTTVPYHKGKPPFELHFYPHNRVIYVVGIR